VIGVNGAAALLTAVGHRVIVCAFCRLELEEMSRHRPKVVICDRSNGVDQLIEYDPAMIH
jgi:aspartate 1-decarboxylase